MDHSIFTEVPFMYCSKHSFVLFPAKNVGAPKNSPQQRVICNVCGKAMNKFALRKITKEGEYELYLVILQT